MEDRKFVRMGRFTSSVGLKGEMKVTLYNEETVNFKKGAEVYLDVSGGKKPFTVRSVRNHNGTVIAALEGVADRNASDSLRNTEFFMDEEDLEELPEGYHYVEDWNCKGHTDQHPSGGIRSREGRCRRCYDPCSGEFCQGNRH